MVLYHAGDMAGAVMQQHKELIINERCLGLDHPDTAHRYSLSYFSWSISLIIEVFFVVIFFCWYIFFVQFCQLTVGS